MADEETEKEQGEQKDPLSFFAAGDDSSSSDSENDDDTSQKIKSQTDKRDEVNNETWRASKLPSPHTLFATVGRPKFLNRLQEESAVDWDELSTRYNPAIIAAAPIVSLEEREKDEAYSDATVASTPVQYGKELSDIQKHILLHDKRGSDIRLMAHRESSQKEEGESSAKKMKADSFHQKEKRKRDVGQANRDKSYVEEEKRILRQGVAPE